MIIRPYQPTDLEGVLAVIQDAARQDRTRVISREAFANTWLAYALSPNQVRYDESAVVTDAAGAVWGFMWWEGSLGDASPHASAATNLAEAPADIPREVRFEGWVHPRWRRRGVGTALLTALEVQVRTQLRGPVRLSGRGLADIPGLLPLFQLKGYAPVRTFYTMRTPLPGRVFTPDPPPGFTLKTFQAEHLDQLVETDNRIFAEHWGALPRTVDTFRHHLIDTRPHDPKLWVLAWDGDRLVGECLSHAGFTGEPNDGHVAHVGVLREYRGRGLGRLLLSAGLARLQAMGFETATLNVDAENAAAINLYRSLGMNVIRERVNVAKTIVSG